MYGPSRPYQILIIRTWLESIRARFWANWDGTSKGTFYVQKYCINWCCRSHPIGYDRRLYCKVIKILLYYQVDLAQGETQSFKCLISNGQIETQIWKCFSQFWKKTLQSKKISLISAGSSTSTLFWKIWRHRFCCMSLSYFCIIAYLEARYCVNYILGDGG